VLSINSYTQQWQRFVNWNEGECIAKQNDSIIWVGTKVGLVRWNITNGSNKTYGIEEGLPSTYINDIEFDKLGNVWLATNNSLVKFNGITFEIFNSLNTPLPEAPFTKIAIDSKNNVYSLIGSYAEYGWWQIGGVASFVSGNWKIFKGSDYNFTYPPGAIVILNDTVYLNVSIGEPQFDCKMLYLDGTDLKEDVTWPFSYYIENFAIDYEDSLWAACGLRLFKKRNNTWEEIIGDNSGLGSVWYFAWSNGFDGLWLGGSGPYLYYLNIDMNRRGIRYDPNLPPGLKQIWNSTITEKFNDHIALSSNSQYFVSINGLFRYDVNGIQKNHFEINKTIERNNVVGLGISPDNDIYISGPDQVQKFNGVSWDSVLGYGGENNDFKFSPNNKLFTENYPLRDPQSGTYAGIDFDGFGNLWAAYGYITQFKWPNMTRKKYSFEEIGINSGSYAQFMDVVVDKDERVWAAGWYNYIAMFDRTSWHIFRGKDIGTVYGVDIDYVYTDSKGRVWFCTNQWSPNEGIILFENNNWRIIRFTQLWRGQYVYQIAEDHIGNLWFATEAGILKFDNHNWYILSDQNSYLDLNDMKSITVDLRGNIWIGSSAGLYIYNPYNIDFSTDITINPIDSLMLSKVDCKTLATFLPKNNLNEILRYELQRGRMKHKFWTISAIEKPFNQSSVLEISDTSFALNDYLYRIKAVDNKGRAYYSNYVSFKGDSVFVNIENFNAQKSGYSLLLSWTSNQERHIAYYKVSVFDSTVNSYKKIYQTEPFNDGNKHEYQIIAQHLQAGAQKNKYSLEAVFVDSSFSQSQIIEFTPSLPEEFFISQNYPNPFNNSTTFEFKIPYRQKVQIKIFDVLGQFIFTAIDKEFNEGYYSEAIEFNNLSSGVYLYSIKADNFFKAAKMLYLK
jgi:ligand-binding sensor domain-containing protein